MNGLIGMRVSDLFDVVEGAAEEAGALGRALHDLAGNGDRGIWAYPEVPRTPRRK